MSTPSNALNIKLPGIVKFDGINAFSAVSVPITVPNGGTGDITLTNHGIIIGQGTSPLVATSAGSAGQVLQSGGASADPAYSTATYPSTAGTSGNVLTSNGTNWTSAAPAAGGVTGPGSSTDRAISTWNGTGGAALFNNSTTNIDSTGRFTNTAQTAFRAVLAVRTASVTGDNTFYTILYDSLVQNGSAFNGGSGVFTAPVTGFYQFTISVSLLGLNGTNVTIYGQLVQNSNVQAFEFCDQPVVGTVDINTAAIVKGSFMGKMTAGDTMISQIAVTGSGKNVQVDGGENTNPVQYGTYFCGYLVC